MKGDFAPSGGARGTRFGCKFYTAHSRWDKTAGAEPDGVEPVTLRVRRFDELGSASSQNQTPYRFNHGWTRIQTT